MNGVLFRIFSNRSRRLPRLSERCLMRSISASLGTYTTRRCSEVCETFLSCGVTTGNSEVFFRPPSWINSPSILISILFGSEILSSDWELKDSLSDRCRNTSDYRVSFVSNLEFSFLIELWKLALSFDLWSTWGSAESAKTFNWLWPKWSLDLDVNEPSSWFDLGVVSFELLFIVAASTSKKEVGLGLGTSTFTGGGRIAPFSI